MLIAGETKKERIVGLTCDCGCNEGIHILKQKDPNFPDEYYLSIIESKFNALQDGVFSKIKHRIKRVFFAMLGKDYKLCEICITETDIDNLIQALQNIKTD